MMEYRLPRWLVLLVAPLLVAPALVATSCSEGTDLPQGEPAFKLLRFSPTVLVPGTKLVVTGEGFRANEPMKLTFSGAMTYLDGRAGGALEFELVPTVDSGSAVVAEIPAALFDAAGGDGHFEGKLGVETVRGGQRHAAAFSTKLGLARELVPTLAGVSTTAIYFGDHVKLRGDGFLLGGAEGELEVLVTGTFRPDGEGDVGIERFPIAVRATERTEAVYVHRPELFGLKSGEFRGTFVARNRHRDGTVAESEPLPVDLVVLRSSIAALAPREASREQRVRVGGNGFLTDPTAGVATELRLRGRLELADGSSENVSLDLPVRVEAPDQAVWVLQPQLVDEELRGFGAKAGAFTGTITPVLATAREELAGESWQGTFTILPTKQVVHVKFTPGFTDALRYFGLRNLERQVKDRILEVARRDYSGYNVEFREERPTDWEQYTTIEVTGDDPNEVDLFGLDNTDGKDLGNLRLNDYVGGSNPEQIENGAFAYGGVFLASLLRFSPNVCRKETPEGLRIFVACPGKSSFPLASDRFDAIFKAFAPLLKGTEAKLSELTSGPRKAQVQQAVRVLGNLAGNTLVHELGHSLGLAQDIGTDEFHNAGDMPGLIMNPGGARTFEERAELEVGGVPQGPAAWAPGDADYLSGILPK